MSATVRTGTSPGRRWRIRQVSESYFRLESQSTREATNSDRWRFEHESVHYSALIRLGQIDGVTWNREGR